MRDADVLFIEAVFAGDDAELARQRAHLTFTAAGEIARAADARRIEPFHFSPRYAEAEQRMLDEVRAAFTGARWLVRASRELGSPLPSGEVKEGRV